MAKILLTCPIERQAQEAFESQGHQLMIQKLEADWDVALHQAEAWVTMVGDRIPPDKIKAASSLKVIANHAVGYDNIPIEVASQAGIWVSNTPGVLTDATAELALSLLLALSRRIFEGDSLVRSGQWKGWEPTQLLGPGLHGKTLGIIGAGRIGQALGHLVAPFKMKLLYTSRQPKTDFEHVTAAQKVDLHTLLSESDCVSMHLPSTPQTRHTLNAERLKWMKPGAILVNTGRGNAIDEEALVAHLQHGHLKGVALDVFEREPQLARGLRELSRVILTPHIGSATITARRAMGLMCLDNIAAALQGHTPPQALNAL